MQLLKCVFLVIVVTPVVYTECIKKNCTRIPRSCQYCEFEHIPGIIRLKHVNFYFNPVELKLVNCHFEGSKRFMVLYGQIHMLWVENCVEFLENDAFAFSTEAYLISLTKNNISLIPNYAFQGFSNLDTVDFSQNRIVKIGKNVFTGASSITHLNLSHNRIESFSIKELVNLEWVNLENNVLTVLSEFPKIVKTVRLGFNRLTKITNGTFHNTKLLERVELQWNNITEIESGAFYNHLDYANFTSNNLTTLSNLMDGNASRKLDYTVNQIVEFSGKYWHKYQTFKFILQQNQSFSTENLTNGSIKLDLSQNGIEKLDKSKFNVNINIKALDLSQNEIKIVPVGFFNGSHPNFLKKLNLSTNAITQLEVGSLLGLASLELLDLSHNRLETLYAAVFLNTPNLQTLNLADNRIRNLNGLEIVRLTRLTLIGLGGNEFSINYSDVISHFKDNNVRVVYNSNREDKNKFGNNSDDNLQDL